MKNVRLFITSLFLSLLFATSANAETITTQEYLSSKGVTMQVARDFIVNNLGALETVYNVCKQYGVNNDMIAEILASDYPGLTGEVVSSFFDANGLSGNALGFSTPSGNPGNSTPLSGFEQNLPSLTGVSINIYSNVSAEYAQMLKVVQYAVPTWYQTTSRSLCTDNGFTVLHATSVNLTEYVTPGFPQVAYLCDIIEHSALTGASGDYIVFNVSQP